MTLKLYRQEKNSSKTSWKLVSLMRAFDTTSKNSEANRSVRQTPRCSETKVREMFKVLGCKTYANVSAMSTSFL